MYHNIYLDIFVRLQKTGSYSRKEVSSDNRHFITVWPSGGGSFRQIIKEVKTENHTGAAKKLFLHLI